MRIEIDRLRIETCFAKRERGYCERAHRSIRGYADFRPTLPLALLGLPGWR